MPRQYLRTSLVVVALCVIVGVSSGSDQTCSSDSSKNKDGSTCTASNKDDGAVTDCLDLQEKCLEWAERGECTTNAAFMNSTCRQSCELCPSAAAVRVPEWEGPEECEDLHPKCSEWAKVGECVGNPGYMLVGCKRSCYKCMNVRREREEGLDEEEILKRYRFLHGDWGETQSLGGDGDQAKTKEVMIFMMKYALNNVSTFPLKDRLACKNSQSSCAFWAASGECENNLAYMMTNCALACQFCDKTLAYDKCRRAADSVVPSWLQPGEFKAKFEYLKTKQNAKLALEVDEKDHNHPWVLKVDDFISSEEADELLTFAKALEWKPSKPIIEENLKERIVVRRESTSAFCKNCTTAAAPYAKLQQKILDLVNAKPCFMEPMEFVHYSKFKSFAMHHDFSVHDVWMPAGPRVLSVFLCLSDVPEGGAMGFPNLDWLSLPPKKGQLLVWPNVLSSDPTKIHKDMMSESLPVLRGEKYGVHAWIRLHDYEIAEKIGCV